MTRWWLSDFERVERERKAVEELGRDEPWLLGAEWALRGSDLCVDAEIEAGGARYSIQLLYPPFFPATPPAVWPQDREAPRWSGHQYGSGGELCLEWGPDNWQPEVTGADMLRSAHRLLDGESLGNNREQAEVPSRHETTLGQDLRAKWYRLVLTEGGSSHLRGVASGAQAGLRLLLHRTSLVAVLMWVERDGQRWTDEQVPSALKHVDISWKALLVRTSGCVADVRPGSLEELRGLVSGAGLDESQLDAVDENGRHLLDSVLFVDEKGEAALVWVSDRQKGSARRFETIVVPTGYEAARVGPGGAAVSEKRVGVVGLGSAGSKVALMLARSGVRRFVLVDDDVFLPENLVRHALDWRSVGEHKVDGVAFQLELLAPDVTVDIERRRLTGQEATSSVAAALKALGSCDLIVDATACGRTFGLLGTVARQSETALVWLEVYAGGIGGLVCRYRPGQDPDPFVMRGKVNAFYKEQEAPEVVSTGAYTAAGPDEEPLVASDADVEVISSHAARVALDALSGSEPSMFPYSVYLIGLSRAWVFKEPFHTIPLDMGESEPERERSGQGPAVETVKFLTELVEQSTGGG